MARTPARKRKPAPARKRKPARNEADEDMALLRRCVARGRVVIGKAEQASAERLASRGLVTMSRDDPKAAYALIATTDGRKLARSGAAA